MSVGATLDNYPLLSSSPVRWEIKTGIEPYEAIFDLRPDDADSLLTGPMRPISLSLTDGRGRQVRIDGLYVLSRDVGENPYIARVLVVDRRWFWSHTHVVRNFNVRRTVGSKRQRAPDTPPELQPLDPEIAYWPWSLNTGRTWKAKEILDSVLRQINAPEQKLTGSGPATSVSPDIGSLLSNLPVEDLSIDDPGDRALGRVLSYLPEAEVVIDASGALRIFSRATGAEESVIQNAGAESVGGGHVELISNARIRPSKIHVLFTREHEIRFDWGETGTPTHTQDERYMDNVLPVPDYQLTLRSGEGQAVKDVSQGTWIDFVTALRSWGAPPKMTDLSGPDAWFQFIRRASVPFMDMWTPIGLHGIKDPDADWVARIGAIQTHYRRTFRIQERWMARILQLKASKLATINPVTGTRAPALAYADYARMASLRSLYRDDRNGAELAFAINELSSPPSASAEPSGPPAPAVVTILDHDQGIIHLDFRGDPYRVHEMLMPSMVELEGDNAGPGKRPDHAGPTGNIEDVLRPISYNALGETHRRPQLTANHRVAVILTAIPAGNNSLSAEQLFRVTVTPSEVSNLLPPTLRNGIQDSKGPELELRIGANIETARVAWMLTRADDIERSFGVSDGGFNIDDLVINLDGDREGGASLRAIAQAVAARTWAALTDRWQGSKTVRLENNVEVHGAISSVTHKVETKGQAETRITLPGKLPPIDVFSLLPENTRKIILRLAPSPGRAAG